MTALRSQQTVRDLRRGAVAFGWFLVLAMAWFTATRWWDASTRNPVLIAAATGAPVVLLPAWAVLLTAAVFRRIVLGTLALLLCVAQLQVSYPLLHGGRGLAAAQRAPNALHLRVMTLNVKFDVDDGAAVSAQVRAANPDIVVLNEVSQLTYRHLDLNQYAYSFVQDDGKGAGFGIWARWPVSVLAPPRLRLAPFHVAGVAIPGHELTLLQVHTLSPTGPERAGVWRNQLRGIAYLETLMKGPVIMAGDFNASRTSTVFRSLLGGRLGMADAADGRGYLTTWPSGKAIPPVLRLDHVLVSKEIGVRDARVLGPTGSDHRAVLADVVIA